MASIVDDGSGGIQVNVGGKGIGTGANTVQGAMQIIHQMGRSGQLTPAQVEEAAGALKDIAGDRAGARRG